MIKNYFYGISLVLLALFSTACACRHWDWTCVSCSKNSKSIVKEEVKVAPVQVAAAPVAEPAVAAAVPVVVPVVAPVNPVATGYNFGDHKSVTLTTKAWQALAQKDTAAVVTYSGKCVDMYSAEAAKMQASLKEYPAGENQQVFAYWALNDVATSLFIQGEAYRRDKQMDLAKAAYQRVINEFSFGQSYDPGSKTFWRPADSARDGLYMIEKGLDLDFGNMTSLTIVRKMWASLANKNLEEVIAYDMKLERLYADEAKSMQKMLKEYPQLPAENIHKYWALNDVGTGMFILGEAYNIAGMKEDALKAYNKVVADYFYAQCWDEQGWFWKPVDAAQQKLIELQVQN